MGFRGLKMASWMLIILTLIVTTPSSGTPIGKTQETTFSPFNATQENSSNKTLVYEMDYAEYPVGLVLTYNGTYGLGAYNESYNDTYGLGAYYYDYYGQYAYPQVDSDYDEMVSNSTEIVNSTLMTTKRTENGTRIPKAKRSRRKTRSVSEERNIKQLCIKQLINVTNISDKYIRHIFECKAEESKYLACLNSKGYIKPCYMLKNENKPEVPLCIEKDNAYVTTCNSPEPQGFCFTDPKETNRILKCNDQKLRVCFSGGLAICNNQEKKRVPREVNTPNKPKPDVNCNNCEVEIKMLVDEMAGNSPPEIQVKITDLDPLEKMMDAVDIDFEK